MGSKEERNQKAFELYRRMKEKAGITVKDEDREFLETTADMVDHICTLSYFENDDWYDKRDLLRKMPQQIHDCLRVLTNYGILEKDNRITRRIPGSDRKQKKFLHYRLAPVIRPIQKGMMNKIEMVKEAEGHTDVSNDSLKQLDVMVCDELGMHGVWDDDGNFIGKNEFMRYYPYHLMNAIGTPDVGLISTPQLEKLFPKEKEPEQVRPKFNKKDLSKIIDELGKNRVRMDLCEDVYRYIRDAGKNGVTKREIVNELWLKHAYEYTLQHIDTVCRILIRAGYIKEYDTSKEIVFCDASVKDEDIPKRERLVRTKEEQERDEYLILKVMEQCETSYRFKDIENLTGINSSAVRTTVLSLVERGLIKRIEDGIDAVSFCNLDYEGLCREVHEKELQYGIVNDNGHTYVATELPEEQTETPQEQTNVDEEVKLPVEEEEPVRPQDNGEYDYPEALVRMYNGIAVVSMSSARVYHLIVDKGLRCADNVTEPIMSFTKEEMNGGWRDMPDIKDCPCCKSPSTIQFNDDRTEYWCECMNCHVGTRHEPNIITAISTWNTRA